MKRGQGWEVGGRRPCPGLRRGRGRGQGGRCCRLSLERLEERVMLDSSPPSIVVGRTLSAYFAGDIQNSQETITYTVYNETADALSGASLTTTLHSGVTFTSASVAPVQTGAQLSWNL